MKVKDAINLIKKYSYIYGYVILNEHVGLNIRLQKPDVLRSLRDLSPDDEIGCYLDVSGSVYLDKCL